MRLGSLITIGLCGALVHGSAIPSGRSAQPEVCTSPECKELGAIIARYTSTNTSEVDLCENFETFVCDAYRKETRLGPGQSIWVVDYDMQNRSDLVLKEILEGNEPPVDSPIDRELFVLAKTAYDVCMDEAKVKSDGISPLVRKLERLAELFPVEESSYTSLNSTSLNETDTGLREALVFLQQARVPSTDYSVTAGPVIAFGTQPDDMNPERRIPRAKPPYQMTLPPSWYDDSAKMAEYLSIMTKTLAVVHPSKAARGKASELAAQVIDLERRVTAVLPSRTELDSPENYYNPTPLDEAAKSVPLFGIDYVVKALAPPGYAPDKILFGLPDAIKKISSIYLSTSRETVQTYLMWRVADDLVLSVVAPEMEPLQKFKLSLVDLQSSATPGRWPKCVEFVGARDVLGWIVGRFYLQKKWSAEASEQMGELTRYLKNEFAEELKSSAWLDESAKSIGVEKLEKMEVQFPGPEGRNPVNVSDASALKEFYRAVNLTTTNFDNVWSLRVWLNNRVWNLLSRTDLEPEWLGPPHIVNAYSSVTAIMFPAAYLQTPKFHPGYPSAVNFGSAGQVVGHEISHGFDTTGRLYTPEGKFENWWSNTTEKEYNRRAGCFVEQYGGFTFEGPDGKIMKVDGELTVDENIADSGGLNAAFGAWERHRKDRPERDMALPGLERWTPEQQFFLAFAYSGCGTWTKEGAAWLAETNPHALSNFRVTGPLQNSQGFREAFGCKVKEPTCPMW